LILFTKGKCADCEFSQVSHGRTEPSPNPVEHGQCAIVLFTGNHTAIIRVTNTWNSLLNFVVLAPSLNSFKNRLDKFRNNVIVKMYLSRMIRAQMHLPICSSCTFIMLYLLKHVARLDHALDRAV